MTKIMKKSPSRPCRNGDCIASSPASGSKGETMRSELVFSATKYVPNRYLLTRLAAKAIRALHKPKTRIQETANEVFHRFSLANPIAHKPAVHRQAFSD